VHSKEAITLRSGSANPSKSELVKKGAVGSFTPSVLEAFRLHPELALRQAKNLLDAHFPLSLHMDIASAVGIDLEGSGAARRMRNPKFRGEVLVAYEYKCAVCGLDMRIGSVTVGIEAAHIEWHQAGGPDTPSNGLALCSLHHKLLDLGAYTILNDLRLLVSEHAHGGEGFGRALLDYHGKEIRRPQNPEKIPAKIHLEWHRREVFKENGRFVG
jgi:putative restriction endonuclease